MKLQMSHLLNLKFALYAVGAVLAVIGVSNAFVAIFVPSPYEVSYRYDTTVSYCAEGRCAFHAMLEVANTGREAQRDVSIVIAGLPVDVSPVPRILNLDASFPREADPSVERQRDGDRITLQLHGFMPGTLAQFHVAGEFDEAQLARALEPDIRITARGRVVEGNPRGIALGRLFSLDASPLTVLGIAPISAG